MSTKERKLFAVAMTATLILLAIAFAFTIPAQAASNCSIPLAHRGAQSSTIDENSIASITRMKGKGVAEIDVRLTSDGVPILMHDSGVARVTNGTGLVNDLTLAQIKALELNKSKDRVPTFRQAVNAAEQSHVRLVAELKQYPQWTPELLERVGRIATNADVRVYVGGKGRGFETTVPLYSEWVYWRPAKGIEPTPSNAAEYGADLILDHVRNWTKKLVNAAEVSGYITGVRLTNRLRASIDLGVGYILTNQPFRVVKLCKESS